MHVYKILNDPYIYAYTCVWIYIIYVVYVSIKQFLISCEIEMNYFIQFYMYIENSEYT